MNLCIGVRWLYRSRGQSPIEIAGAGGYFLARLCVLTRSRLGRMASFEVLSRAKMKVQVCRPAFVSRHYHVAFVVLAVLLTPGASLAEEEGELRGPGWLGDLQQKIVAAAARGVRSVVAVETAKNDGGFASGVIVSADGMVLSQFHISHQLDFNFRSRKTGEHLRVITHDGTTYDAILLGANAELDLSLLQITAPGPFDFAPLEDRKVSEGDWVLKIGHAGGYAKGRAPVTRLGKVLLAENGVFVNDCPIDGGDSGGPFFDVNGSLVGLISSSIRDPRNRHAPPAATALTNSKIMSAVGSMKDGRITGISDRLQRKKGHFQRLVASLRKRHDRGVWSEPGRKNAVKDMFHSAVESLDAIAVRINDEVGNLRVYGTIVEKDGFVLTKASELPTNPRCIVSSGASYVPQLVGINPKLDLALLKIDTTDLSSAVWSDEVNLPVGTFVASPSSPEKSRAVGIVSGPRRSQPGPYPASVTPARYPGPPARPPAIIGSTVSGRGYWVEFVDHEAKRAGIESGDLLISIADTNVYEHRDLLDCVKGLRAGASVSVKLQRSGQQLVLEMRLCGAQSLKPPRMSDRHVHFPEVFEHDMPLSVRECGGPVMNSLGQVVGITIARLGDYGGLALPSSVVLEKLSDLKSGSPLRQLPKVTSSEVVNSSQATRSLEEQAGISLEDLKLRLSRRNRRYRSLVVEYSSVTRGIASPASLASWDMNIVRDSEMIYREGFSGETLFYRTTLPDIQVWSFPRDKARPAETAPVDVAKRIRQSAQGASILSSDLNVSHMFTLTNSREKTHLFIHDGGSFTHFVGDLKWPTTSARFQMPVMYLANIGLRPQDPELDEANGHILKQYLFPANFEQFANCEVLPMKELIQGKACVGVEASWMRGDTKVVDKIWFDPSIDYSPRKWTQHLNGRLQMVRTNSDFEELETNCWLPWRATWAIYPPEWAGAWHSPAYELQLNLKQARVNQKTKDEIWRDF